MEKSWNGPDSMRMMLKVLSNLGGWSGLKVDMLFIRS